MTWGVSKDVYINLDIDLGVLNFMLGEYVLPHFGDDIKSLKAVAINMSVTTSAYGDIYREQVVICYEPRYEVSVRLVRLKIDELFKLIGLTSNDYKFKYYVSGR